MHSDRWRRAAAIPRGVTLAVVAGALAAASLSLAPTPALAADGDVRVVVVGSVAGPASETGLLDAEELAEAFASGGVLAGSTSALSEAELTVGIDPALAASVRLLGTNAPLAAQQWLTRATTAAAATFPLAFADADLTAFTQSTAGAVPMVPSLSFALDPEGFTDSSDDAEATPEPTATTSPEPTSSPAPVIPTITPTPPSLEQALDLAPTIPALLWPRAGTVAAGDLAKLADGPVLLAGRNVAGGAPSGAIASIDGRIAVVANDSISDLAGQALSAPDSSSNAQRSAVLASAILSTADASGDAQPVIVIALDRTPLWYQGQHVAATLAALDADARIDVVRLDEVLPTSADGLPAATLIEADQPDGRVSEITRLVAANAQVAQFSTIGEKPAAIQGEQAARTLAVGSNAWVTHPDWSAAVTTALDDATATLGSVTVLDSSTVNLFASSSSLPVAVRNDLDQRVTVFVTLQSSSPLLTVTPGPYELSIPAASQGTIEVPVQAVSSGTVAATSSAWSSTGLPIGRTTTTEINVQAAWETPITLIAGALLVLLFVGGLIRTVAKSRRRRRGDDTSESDANPAPEPAADTAADPS